MDSSKPHQARSSSASKALLLNKERNVGNVKAYCVAKITKTLDTKKALEKVERTSVIKKEAATVVQ